jgi:hypothetical protein
LKTLVLTLSNGETCVAGTIFAVDKSHAFEPNKNIAKIEVVIHSDEEWIIRINRGDRLNIPQNYSSSLALYTYQINFYSGQERLVKVGGYNDVFDVKTWGGRVETF